MAALEDREKYRDAADAYAPGHASSGFGCLWVNPDP